MVFGQCFTTAMGNQTEQVVFCSSQFFCIWKDLASAVDACLRFCFIDIVRYHKARMENFISMYVSRSWIHTVGQKLREFSAPTKMYILQALRKTCKLPRFRQEFLDLLLKSPIWFWGSFMVSKYKYNWIYSVAHSEMQTRKVIRPSLHWMALVFWEPYSQCGAFFLDFKDK